MPETGEPPYDWQRAKEIADANMKKIIPPQGGSGTAPPTYGGSTVRGYTNIPPGTTREALTEQQKRDTGYRLDVRHLIRDVLAHMKNLFGRFAQTTHGALFRNPPIDTVLAHLRAVYTDPSAYNISNFCQCAEAFLKNQPSGEAGNGA